MKRSNLSTRIQSVILALTMIFALANPALMLNVAAADAGATASKTEGQIVAENYDLFDGEAELISSAYVNANTLSYTKPTASDELISVETDAHTVTVETYTNGGYTWIPASARVDANGYQEDVALTLDGAVYTGNYVYDGAAFSIVVKFELRQNLDDAKQKLLLEAPEALKAGLAHLESMKSVDSALSSILLGMDELKELASDEGKFIPLPAFGPSAGTRIKLSEAGKVAVNALAAQAESNANGVFDFNAVIAGYGSSTAKVKYLVDNAANIKSVLESTYAYVKQIRNDNGGTSSTSNIWDDIAFYGANAGADVSAVLAISSNMDTWLAAAEAALAGDWRVAENVYLKPGLSSSQYGIVDGLVNSVTDTKGDEAAIQENLLVDTAEIQFNMSMSDVTVNVELWTANGVVGSTELTLADSDSAFITLADGATKTEILAAIGALGFEDAVVATWGEEYVAEKFSATYSVLPDVLEGDVTYTVKYQPKSYTVTRDYATDLTVPYGYLLKLDTHETAGKAYDYFVNGSYFAENTVVMITDNTAITRSEGKSYTDTTVVDVIVDNIFGVAGDTKAENILTSDVLRPDKLTQNEVVSVRYPEPGKDDLVKIEGTILKADAYASSYNGLFWMPYSYTVIVDGNRQPNYFDGATEADIAGIDFDGIEVIYRLTLTNLDRADVSDLANLPDVLEKDAVAQKSALDRLANLRGEMAAIDNMMLGGLNGMIGTLNVDQTTKDSLTDAVSDVINNSLDIETGKLKLYNMLGEYATGGLVYYYRNSAVVIDEINSLIDKLNALLDTQAERDALAILLSSPSIGKPEYVEKIDSLGKKMAEISEDLTPPNEVINVNSADLYKLVAALTAAGDAGSYTVDKDLYLESDVYNITPLDKKTFVVSVGIEGKKAETAYSNIFEIGYVITNLDVTEILTKVNAAIAALGVSDDYYTNNFNKAELEALAGSTVSENLAFSYTWGLKTFAVSVEGMADQYVDLNTRKIILPVSTDSAFRYDYYANGVKLVADEAGEYIITDENLAAIVAGTFSITRTVVDVKYEELTAFVNGLNNSTASNAIVFALLMDGDDYSIVMKLDLADTNGLMSALPNAIQALASAGYSRVEMDGEGFIYTENNALAVSLQTVVDALMNSGFGTDTLLTAIDANGNVNNVALNGVVVSDKALGNAGGLLFETDLTLVRGTSDSKTLPLYVTMGSAAGQLVELRNMLAGDYGKFITAECKDGKANLFIDMPEKAYEAFLAALLATDNLDISNIDAVNAQIAFEFIQDFIAPVFGGEVTVNTLTNTLAQLGYKYDLSKYSKIFDKLSSIYNGMTFTYDEKTATANANIAISGIIDSMNLGDFGQMIAEYDEGIDITLAMSLNNIGTEYDAIYVDIDAEGLTSKAGLTKDVAAKVKTLAGRSVIVLLRNVNGDLVFDDTVVLDLNGFTVNGKIVSDGNVIVIDTPADPARVGSVTGGISGNVTVAGGAYAYDVSEFVKEGYVQNANGEVANKFYNITYVNGVVTVEINAGLLATNAMPNEKVLLANLAADLIMNGYTAGSLYVEGNMVYDITLDDLISLYTASGKLDLVVSKLPDMFDSAELADIVNMIFNDLKDFETLESNIRNNKPILSYDITFGTWTAELVRVAEKDCLTVDITSGTADRAAVLNVVIVGEQQYKDLVAGIAAALADTVSAELTVKGDHYFDVTNDKNFILDWSASGALTIDLSKDAKYTIALGILLADGTSGTAKQDLVNAIKAYYEYGEIAPLKRAFDELTTKQVITAIKSFYNNDDFAKMIDKLGLTDCIGSDVVELEACFDKVVKVAAALLRRIDITGGNRKIKTFFGSDNVYEFNRSNVSRDLTIKIGYGYTVTLEAEVESAYVKLVLFGDIDSDLDYTALNALLNYVDSLNASAYTPESWDALCDAYNAAVKAGNDAIVQKQIDDAVKMLQKAIDELVPVGSGSGLVYTALDEYIARAQALNSANYTSESWAALEVALDKALAARATATTQTAINTAANELARAIGALVRKGSASGETVLNFSELEKQIAIAKTLEEDRYTEASWNAFKEALAEAEAAMLSAKTQTEINAAVTSLKNAITALVKLPIDAPETDKPVDPPVDVEPGDDNEDPDDRKTSPLVWIIPSISIASIAVVVAAVFLIRKRRLIDKTPLINYSAEDDVL